MTFVFFLWPVVVAAIVLVVAWRWKGEVLAVARDAHGRAVDASDKAGKVAGRVDDIEGRLNSAGQTVARLARAADDARKKPPAPKVKDKPTKVHTRPGW